MELVVDPDMEIDPDLYMKCRLCIKERGSYRIHGVFQEQIKYCFDITVSRLDELPQLICKKCKVVLLEHCALKKTFIENQTTLVQLMNQSIAENSTNSEIPEKAPSPKIGNDKTEIENDKTEIEEEKTREAIKNDAPTEDDIEEEKTHEAIKNDSPTEDEVDGTISRNRKNPKKRKALILSTSSSSADEESTNVPITLTVPEESKPIQASKEDDISMSWQNSYEKKFVCRFCNLKFSSRQLINMHIKEHSTLMTTYKKLIKNHCKVMIEKVELKPNVTGNTEAVVLAPDNIVRDEGSVRYFVRYLPMNSNDSNDIDNVKKTTSANKRNRNSTSKRFVYYDSSDIDNDDDDDFKPVKKKRRIRSRSSSNETVVLDRNSAKRTENSNQIKRIRKRFESQDDSPDASICVDDSSNDSNALALSGTQLREHKMIQDITLGCYKKYLSGNKDGDKSSKDDNLLNKKLLSTGRKVLSTQGTTTNGLTKYLHHKHLHVCWVPVNKQLAIGNKTVYARINTKLDALENNEDTTGWTIIKKNENFGKAPDAVESSDDETLSAVSNGNQVDPVEANNQDEILKETAVPDEPITPAAVMVPANEPVVVADTPAKLTKNVNANSTEASDLLVKPTEKRSDPVMCYENKLLNANPVANPKQLPKKNTFHDVKPNVSALQKELEKDTNRNVVPMQNAGESICIDSDEDSSVMPMPIIMSTTSLAQNTDPVPAQPTEPENTSQNNTTATECAKEKVVTEQVVPRIKCKPVAELMAPQNGVNSSSNTVAIKRPSLSEAQQPIVYGQPQLAVYAVPQQAYLAPQPVPPTPSSLNIQIDNGSITMNSVDLPNTSTKHPIEYFKTLLKMRGLVLVTTVNVALSRDFVCLVKFRLDVSQNDKSIILSLALYASKNVFCIKLRNSPSNDEMDIDKLPATWQLHVLKAFRGEVSEKILQFASKVSNVVSEHAKTFVLLLKNIEYKFDIVNK